VKIAGDPPTPTEILRGVLHALNVFQEKKIEKLAPNVIEGLAASSIEESNQENK
jgi:Ni,Fe-hydrogenase III small subunit